MNRIKTKTTTVHCAVCGVAIVRKVGHPDTKPRAKPTCYTHTK